MAIVSAWLNQQVDLCGEGAVDLVKQTAALIPSAAPTIGATQALEAVECAAHGRPSRLASILCVIATGWHRVEVAWQLTGVVNALDCRLRAVAGDLPPKGPGRRGSWHAGRPPDSWQPSVPSRRCSGAHGRPGRCIGGP